MSAGKAIHSTIVSIIFTLDNMNEKENTARILKEQPILVTSFWCRFGLHNWTKWGPPHRVNIYLIQEKTCGCCGLVTHRKVMAP